VKYGEDSIVEWNYTTFAVFSFRLPHPQFTPWEVDLIPAQQPDFAIAQAGAKGQLYGHVKRLRTTSAAFCQEHLLFLLGPIPAAGAEIPSRPISFSGFQHSYAPWPKRLR